MLCFAPLFFADLRVTSTWQFFVFKSLFKLSFASVFVCVISSCGLTNRISAPSSPLDSQPENQAPELSLEQQLEHNCYPNGSAALGEWQQLDLWARIRHGFSLPEPDNKRVRQHLSWFKRHPEYITRVSKRGKPYLYYIVNEVEARGMPLEIALLPIVESAFDPFAYSPSRASGIWQFMPRTGKSFGLKQTWWYDGRRDAVAATDAALAYLQQLQKRFDGDWLLALAAYNSGAGTVNRAIRKNKKLGRPTDFWNLDLPKETRDYVPKLVTLAKIYKTPQRYGIDLIELPNQPYFEAIDIGAQIDLAQAAVLAEISMETLYALNSGFNRWATDPQGPHRLLVPVEKAQIFKSGLAKMPPNQRVRWQRHTIKSGETLSHIANKYKVSVASLKSINHLSSSRIREGKTLMVPTAQQGSKFYSYSADQRLNRKQNAGAKSGKQRLTHVVRSGDSFWRLARTYKVKASHIAKWNNMAQKDTLKIGQKLVIWVADSNISSTSPEQTQKVIRKLSYRVRNGDSLYKIASKFRVGVNDIVKWNQINEGKYLQPGQSLVLFVDVKS